MKISLKILWRDLINTEDARWIVSLDLKEVKKKVRPQKIGDAPKS